MRAKVIKAVLSGTAVAALCNAAAAGAQGRPSAEANVALGTVSNQYICAFNETVAPGAVRNEAGRAVGPELGQLLHLYDSSIRGFAVRLPAQLGGPGAQIAQLRANNPNIADCEQDQVVRAFAPPPGKGPGGGGGDSGGGEIIPWGIARVNGGATYTGSNVAWIIDTGIDLDHPDLNVDETRSVTFVNKSSSPNDQNGHGTHVAGTIAAIDNEIGVIGVAAGAWVIAVQVLDRRGSGWMSDVIAGVDHVAGNGNSGDVANMSLGGGASQSLDDAVVAAAGNGIKFTIAAGNSSANANNYSPARANGVNIFTVSAFDANDVFASFSNWGNPPIDFAEPGVSVESTYKDGGYRTLSGTSMAAPHLAGILLHDGDGTTSTDGYVTGDPDDTDDPIGVH